MPARKPIWLRAKLPDSSDYLRVKKVVDKLDLHTVCRSAHCPNIGECWSRGTATIMILGDVCTRSCTFCAVQTGRPGEPDIGEPARAAEAVALMNLKHCVITSVARDDLQDGGAAIWAATIRAIRHRNPLTAVEVLIPDFRGRMESLNTVLDAGPDILNHNMETVKRLQRPIRKTARYERTLWVLKHSEERGFLTKSGIMLGIGEKKHEVAETLKDLRGVGAKIITIGQYLQPSPAHSPVDRWVRPEEFDEWKQFGFSIGFDAIESGPLVRSSYNAEKYSNLNGLTTARINRQLESA